MCSRDKVEVRRPVRELSAEHRDQLSFYNPELHAASFVLPNFARKAINASKQDIFI